MATGSPPGRRRHRRGHFSNAAWRLPPGATGEIGTQYFWATKAPIESAKKSTQDWYRTMGLVEPDNSPSWINDAILYEASASGTLYSRFSDLGGFDNLAKQIDYLADMGINSIWLLNPLTHKDPANPKRGWNHYNPLDYEQIDAASGGVDALGRLIKTMRQFGFHVICEIVPHGGQAPVAMKPDWWTYNRDGSRRKGFGQSLDYSAPGWQSLIQTTVRRLTQEFGFDGWRIDVADGYGINWRAAYNLPHVSKSTRGGSIGMLRAVRNGALEGGVNPVLLPETHEARPEFAPVSGLDYGWDFEFLVEREMLWTLTPAERVRKISEFLRDQQFADPPGTIHLRAPDNHDSAGALFGSGESRFGIGLYRALFGVCSVIDGFPMVYQGQELGSYEYLRRIYRARQLIPELRQGSSDYNAVTGPREVFAVLRSDGQGHAIGLVNLSGRTVEGDWHLPTERGMPGARVYDVISGREERVVGNNLKWVLRPYATAVLRFGPGKKEDLSAEHHRTESPAAPSSPSDASTFSANGLRFEFKTDHASVHTDRLPSGAFHVQIEGEADARVQLEVDGVDRWYVQSIAGLYADRLLRRHYPWPGGTYVWKPSSAWQPDRLWQSAMAPLAAGGAIALTASLGGGVRISDVRTNASNFFLADSSMALSGTSPDHDDRYRCRLELLARDAHLAIRTPPYLGRIWNAVRARAPSEPLRAEFVITPASSIRYEDLDGYLLPEMGHARREIGRAKWTWSPNRIITLDEPNTVTWQRLPLDKDGEYTVLIKLGNVGAPPRRGDSTGVYTIEFDGQPKTWTWDAGSEPAKSKAGALESWARVPVGKLLAGEHELRVLSSRPGAAVGEDLYIASDPVFRPF